MRILYLKISKKKDFDKDLYQSLSELPFENYVKIKQEDNFLYLSKTLKKHPLDVQAEILKKLKIEELEIMGLDEDFQILYRDIIKLELVKLDYLLTDNKTLLSTIAILEAKTENNIVKKWETTDYYEVMARLIINLKIDLDINCSAKKFLILCKQSNIISKEREKLLNSNNG